MGFVYLSGTELELELDCPPSLELCGSAEWSLNWGMWIYAWVTYDGGWVFQQNYDVEI